MIEGLDNVLSSIDSMRIGQSRVYRETIVILANKIEELENRIDKMETQYLIDRFNLIEKEKNEQNNI